MMGDKGGRPFYELPAHIKPCSRIIQETRMQLKYSRRLGSNELPGATTPTTTRCSSSGGGDFTRGSDLLFGTDEEMESSSSGCGSTKGGIGSLDFGGMRPVNTQRPFTPRDSVSLWGHSARKRPPSAITLSRLSIEEVEEQSASRPSSSSSSSTTMSPRGSAGSTGRLRSSYGAKASLGSILPQQPYTPFQTPTCPPPNGSTPQVEHARLRMQSLSLQNDVTCLEPAVGVPLQEPILTSRRQDDKVSGEKSKLLARQDKPSTDPVPDKPSSCLTKSTDNETNTDNGPLTSYLIKEDESDAVGEINNLEVTLEYLRCFVIESTSDKRSKGDMVLILQRLRSQLKEVREGGAGGTPPRLKHKLLRLIFKVVERNQTDEEVLFWASFVLLHCNIMGSNLTTVFKMVFKASRSKGYWDVIKDTEYLEVLMDSFGQICPKSQTESMIYGYGTLKFICMDNSVLNRLVDLNLISIMTLHLKILNLEMVESFGGGIPESIFNGAFQLTSILRSIVSQEGCVGVVASSGLLHQLCDTLAWTIDDIDVLTNTVRILSVVSTNDNSCRVMLNNGSFCESVVKVLKVWYSKDDVMVRLTYCLGNLLANSDHMRLKLFEEPYALKSVLQVLSYNIHKPHTSTSMDILVKTTRILANWILNPDIGIEICEDPDLSEFLYLILQLTDISEELVLCVMSTLNNTSFYKNHCQLDNGTLKTVEYLYTNLHKKDLEARTEAVKVLGNLTRNRDIRLMAANYMDKILLSLEEDREELVCATCGVLINIIIEETVKLEFLRKNGVDKLISVLESRESLGVSLMVTQVIWNLVISNQNVDPSLVLPRDKSDRLKSVLMNKLKAEPYPHSLRSNRVEEDPLVYDEEEYEGGEECAEEGDAFIAQDFHSVARNLVLKL